MFNNSFILLRHSYDDHSYIDGKNNTELTKYGIEIAEDASKRILPLVDSDRVIIRHSTKVRAQQTAEIIADYLMRNNIHCKLEPDMGLTELFQGVLNFGNMPHNDRVNFLQSCWDDFEECRLNGELNHYFGQNKSKSIVLKPGECHNDWAVRIATGLLHTIGDIKNGEYQPIDISHRGSIFVIQNLLQLIDNVISLDDVEKYKTVRMEYCTEYKLSITDINHAEEALNNYVRIRGKNENNN